MPRSAGIVLYLSAQGEPVLVETYIAGVQCETEMPFIEWASYVFQALAHGERKRVLTLGYTTMVRDAIMDRCID